MLLIVRTAIAMSRQSFSYRTKNLRVVGFPPKNVQIHLLIGFSQESQIATSEGRLATSYPASPAIGETSSWLYLSPPLAILPAVPVCEHFHPHDKEHTGQGHPARPDDHLAGQGNRPELFDF